MSSSLLDAQRVINRLRNSDPSKFEEYVRSRITEIVHMEVLEDFLPDNNSNQYKKTHKPAEFLKEMRKNKTKKKMFKGKDGSNMIGADLQNEGVTKVTLLIDYLNGPRCLQQEGLFRKSGNSLRQKKLEEAFNHSFEELQSQLKEDLFSPHDVAGLLKLYLRELPEPLLTSKPQTVYKQLAGYLGSPVKLLECLQLLILLLPNNNCTLLKALLQLLACTTVEPANKMTAKTLGTLFSPHVLSCPPMDAQSVKLQAELSNTALLMAFMIENVQQLFKPPDSIVETIKRHLKHVEQDSKGAVQEQTSRIKDRPLELNCRYAQSSTNDKDFQDMELAKLHSLIASMPNSSKQKKKLIKRIVDTPPDFYNPGVGETNKRSKTDGSIMRKLKNSVQGKRKGSRSNNSPALTNLCQTKHTAQDICHDPSKVLVVHQQNEKSPSKNARVVPLKSQLKHKTRAADASTPSYVTGEKKIKMDRSNKGASRNYHISSTPTTTVGKCTEQGDGGVTAKSTVKRKAMSPSTVSSLSAASKHSMKSIVSERAGQVTGTPTGVRM